MSDYIFYALLMLIGFTGFYLTVNLISSLFFGCSDKPKKRVSSEKTKPALILSSKIKPQERYFRSIATIGLLTLFYFIGEPFYSYVHNTFILLGNELLATVFISKESTELYNTQLFGNPYLCEGWACVWNAFWDHGSYIGKLLFLYTFGITMLLISTLIDLASKLLFQNQKKGDSNN